MENDGKKQNQAVINTVVGSVFGTVNQNIGSGERPDDARGSVAGQLTARQAVIMMTELLNVELERVNQSDFARLVSRVTGLSEGNLRQQIMKIARSEGCDTREYKRDVLVVADLLEPYNSKIARRLRNGVEE